MIHELKINESAIELVSVPYKVSLLLNWSPLGFSNLLEYEIVAG